MRDATHSEDIQEIVREKIWQKTQVGGFHFLPGRSAGGPGKGKLLFMARVSGDGRWGEKGERQEDRLEQDRFQRDQITF
uniref:Uncharacterized protein n=1 Tax=Saimiri boliviensis boliviensis TaxID=39432 RepID=A0A2K6TXV0_SAIBB